MMIKKLLLVCCTAFLLFNCSGSMPEDNEENERRRDRREEDLVSDSRDRNQVRNVCEGNDYTVYSYGDCPEIHETEDIITSPKNVLGKTKRVVDILFVVDTTFSMHYYLHSGFKKRLNKFIPIISKDLNWRIMFTNSAYSDSSFWSFFNRGMNGEAMRLEDRYNITDLRYLDHTVPDYSQVFIYTISTEPGRPPAGSGPKPYPDGGCHYPPYCHTTSNKPLQALQASFAANKHLTRKEADFVSIILSNDDDSSSTTPQDVISEFKKVYGPEKKLLALNLIILPEDRECEENSGAGIGTKIAELAKKTGGGNFSLCRNDFSIVAETLVELSFQ